MFKALVLSALCNLSDEQIEYQVGDQLSLMRHPAVSACSDARAFPRAGSRRPGASLHGLQTNHAPGACRAADAKTVWLYRAALTQAGKVEEVFALLDRCRKAHACADRGTWRGKAISLGAERFRMRPSYRRHAITTRARKTRLTGTARCPETGQPSPPGAARKMSMRPSRVFLACPGGLRGCHGGCSEFRVTGLA